MGIPSDAVLPRKLRELECALRQAFASRRNQETDEKIEEGEIEINDEISRRIEFLRNLLCAEMESHQGSKPTHLFHIAERLALLEDAYQRWLDGGSSPNEDDALDNVSTCSCTFSCFNEEEEEHETPVLEDPWLTEAQVVSLDMKQSGMNLSGSSYSSLYRSVSAFPK